MNIKILSLNILEGGIFFDAILELLLREQPDILCLQEVYNGQDHNLSRQYRSIEVLKKHLPSYEHHFSPELLCVTPEGKVDIGNAIFSKFPIKRKDTYFFRVQYGEYPQVAPGGDWSNHPCNMQSATITVDGSELNIFNIHGVWGFDGADSPDRLLMSKVIVENIKNSPHTLLMGDFNVQPNTKTIENIERHMTNLFKGELKTSFNLAHKDLEKSPGYATAVVDMIFTSPDLKVSKKYVPEGDVSDHIPLICEIEL